jgi:hypothetical protein
MNALSTRDKRVLGSGVSSGRDKRVLGALAALAVGGVVAWSLGWVDRPPPPIRSALHALSASQFPEAITALERGAGLGPCTSGSYGTPADDLAEPLLVDLAQVQLTRSLAAEPVGAAPPTSKEADLAARCARSAAQIIVKNRDFPRSLRARAAAIAGHAAFVLGDDEGAIASYDVVLSLGDGGREATEDAAWNRSLALKRLQSANDPPDSGGGGGGGDNGGAGDGGSDGGADGGADGGDGGDDAGRDGGNDAAADAATDSAAGTSDQAVLERLGKLPGLPTTLRHDPGGPRVLPGAEDK